MKALHCPFLTGLPISQVRQQARELLQLADQCPVMGHVIKYSSAANEVTNTALSGPTAGDFSSYSLVLYRMVATCAQLVATPVLLKPRYAAVPYAALRLVPVCLSVRSPARLSRTGF